METVGKRTAQRYLVVRVCQGCIAALPLSSVSEITRPLRIDRFAGAPAFMQGLAVVRGAPTPVVHLPAMLGLDSNVQPGRFVIVRVGDRCVALAVEGVTGIADLPEEALRQAPPLFQDALADHVEALGTMDRELLFFLRLGHLLPDDLWPLIERGSAEPS